MTLLQNRDNILPLKKGARYAVVGPNAADSLVMWGNYNGIPRKTTTVLEGVVAKVGAENVVYSPGCSIAARADDKGQYSETDGNYHDEAISREAGTSEAGIVDLSVFNDVDAILQVWYPGQAGGEAVADVLFGDYNPAGRLPVTFYASDADLPDFGDYDMHGHTYRYFKGKPLFPFGHGLSFSKFKYRRARVSDGVLRIKVRNIGKMDGDEVVQVYLKKADDADGPIMSLRGFKRVHVKAEEKPSLKSLFQLKISTFSIQKQERWKTLPENISYITEVHPISPS